MVSSRNLRETEPETPYAQTLSVTVLQNDVLHQTLEIDVAVAAAAVASQCTYLPTYPPGSLPNGSLPNGSLPNGTLPDESSSGSGRRLERRRQQSSASLANASVMHQAHGNWRVGQPESFHFTLRDMDGLPVVRETFQGVQRVELLRVQLQRSADFASKPVPLKSEFVGSKQRSDSIENGKVQVNVVLEHAGEHVIRLYGPTGEGNEFEEFPWALQAICICLWPCLHGDMRAWCWG